MRQESAEEKLLKMMQKPGIPQAAAQPASSGNKKTAFVFSMQALNRVLILGIVVCAAGLVYEMRSGLMLMNKEFNFSDDLKTPKAIAEIVFPSARDAKYYLDKVNARNIFRPVDAQAGGKGPGVQTLARRLAKYKLVGVAWLDLPETASIMIEDIEHKTTHFLRQGEQLEGVTVKTIYTDRAVFGYENEETTIKL
ncbi:MAG: hypothetical protein HY591_06410 [Candidatus Omnitrophica bacterium]|nr:hypothetical protein [Candidatus Omnitrophota bacterium]